MKKKQTILLDAAIAILIADSVSGKRLQRNGKRIKKGTINMYKSLSIRILSFEQLMGVKYEILIESKSTERIKKSQHLYWKRFYYHYRNYLFSKKVNAHDNYVAEHMKTLKLVFKYIRLEKQKSIGNYEHLFYNSRIDPAIICFPLDKLRTLISEWDSYSLQPRKKEILAFFLFGISVGLRFSDLRAVKKYQIEGLGNEKYLNCKSQKTGMPTKVKLPYFAIEIANRFRVRNGDLLFKLPGLAHFNSTLKEIGRELGWDWPVMKYTSKLGKLSFEKNKRFYDVISSHIMRRTAITSLLTLGVPESAVRQISGHAKGSKEFYRYVQYAQGYLDNYTDAAWRKLQHQTKPD